MTLRNSLSAAHQHMERAAEEVAKARHELKTRGWPEAAEMTMPATKQIDIWLKPGGIFDQLSSDSDG